jgi:5-guanidino-2-oxopentanoate decarboxylase
VTRLTGRQALARTLRAEGIDVTFGIVGTHNVNLFDGLYNVAGLRVITSRHEQGVTVIECPIDFDAPPPWMP